MLSRSCLLPAPQSTPAKAAPRQRCVHAGCSTRRIPASIHDVDNGKVLGFNDDLSPDHPGYGDAAYKQRRASIACIARDHEVGQPIPVIDYQPQEVEVWGQCLSTLQPLFAELACPEFLQALPLFDFGPEAVPQLQDVSDRLLQISGWQLRPVAGLMHPRDFLAGLAFRHFHSTQYVRHHSQPMYTPEPDVVHELIGHVPMLASPDYARMVQAIGQASLGADDKLIWHLTKVYWYTVEFGTVRASDGSVKAFGSGILSSSAELKWLAEGKVPLRPFDPSAPQPRMSYKDGVQPHYSLLSSFSAGLAQLEAYAESIKQAQQQPRP